MTWRLRWINRSRQSICGKVADIDCGCETRAMTFILYICTGTVSKMTSGVMKDVVMVGGYQEVEVDFVADNPGLTLFHCHQQLHMDFGFMSLFDYV